MITAYAQPSQEVPARTMVTNVITGTNGHFFPHPQDPSISYINFDAGEKREIVVGIYKLLKANLALFANVVIKGIWRRWPSLNVAQFSTLSDATKIGIRAGLSAVLGVPFSQLSAGVSLPVPQITLVIIEGGIFTGLVAFVSRLLK